jgi:mono/diheme cytochrome c family protein
MSDEHTSENKSKASLEKASMQDADMQDIHAQLMREKEEPHEGFSPIPIVLLFVFAGLCFWGGVYFAEYSQEFRWDVYDPEAKLASSSAPRPEKPLAEVGAKIYRAQCVACHQASGLGAPGAFPPLVASPWVVGSEERLARILINGLKGPIEVNGMTYNGNMPAFGPQGLNLKSKQIAAVLSYIRQEWGNAAPEVTVEAMDGYLDAYGARGPQWTVDELLADFPLEPASDGFSKSE